MGNLTIDCIGKTVFVDGSWRKIIAFDMDETEMQIAVTANINQGYKLRETRYYKTTVILAEYAETEWFDWVDTTKELKIK